MNIFMLCGQGSSGKSTFGKQLQSNKQNVAFVRMDNYKSFDLSRFKADSQEAINSKYENIIFDLAFDTAKSRQKFLSSLIFPNEIVNFYCISMRPGWQNIIKWQTKRQRTPLTHSEKEKIKSIYHCFQMPKLEDFESYNFNTINLIARRVNVGKTQILIDDRQFINELEALQIDTQSLQALISYMSNNNCDTTTESFKKIYSEYRETYRQYEIKKHELETRFIYPVLTQPKEWNLDFASGELTVYD